MKSREELREWNQQFWEAFRKYMQKERSASGRRINWLSYPTEIKDIYLRLQTDKTEVRVCFDLQFRDPGIRAVFWEQLGELRKVFESEMGEDAVWDEHCHSEIIPDFCRISFTKTGLNYLSPADQEAIFAFFREKLIAFDTFYQEFKDILLFLAD